MMWNFTVEDYVEQILGFLNFAILSTDWVQDYYFRVYFSFMEFVGYEFLNVMYVKHKINV
jgi:hypothetical protein